MGDVIMGRKVGPTPLFLTGSGRTANGFYYDFGSQRYVGKPPRPMAEVAIRD